MSNQHAPLTGGKAGPFILRDADPSDAAGMLAIYGPVVRSTAISFELEPPSVEEFAERIAQTLETHPWLVCEGDEGVLGYAYATLHRQRPAYRWSTESSVYVAAGHHRRGIARLLYAELFEQLRSRGFYNVFAGITLPNEPSIRLHRSFGFEPVGTFRKVGYKFGAWHDVAWFGLRVRPGEEHPEGPPGTASGE